MGANQIVLLWRLCIDFEITKIEQKITLIMNFEQLGICKDLSVQKIKYNYIELYIYINKLLCNHCNLIDFGFLE